MSKLIPILFIVFIFHTSMGQTCFDGYDALFKTGNEKLSYQEFHQLELNFVKNLAGCNAPDFEVVTIEGEELFLSALKGKVVVLNFWFTTCPPCLKEIPELNKLTNKFNPDEVVFIGLARDTQHQLQTFFNRFGNFEFKIIPESFKIADKYKIVAWPQSFVITKEGTVYKVWAGVEQNPDKMVGEIKNAIDHCLAETN